MSDKHIVLSEELHQKLKVLAAQQGKTLKDAVDMVLRLGLKANKEDAKPES